MGKYCIQNLGGLRAITLLCLHQPRTQDSRDLAPKAKVILVRIITKGLKHSNWQFMEKGLMCYVHLFKKLNCNFLDVLF